MRFIDHRSFRFPRTAIAVLAASALVLGPVSSGAAEYDDATITKTIKKRIAYDDAVHLNNVETLATDGVVTLVGEVDNLLAKRKATRIAETIRGVRAVVNRLQVASTDKDDAQLRRDVRDALVYERSVPASAISVEVKDGTVELEGELDSQAELELAYAAAAGVHGVTDLKTSLTVRPVEGRSDADIEREIHGRIEANAWVDEQPVNVSVKDGAVRLSGEVATAQQRTVVAGLAFVAGVESVDAESLEVTPDLAIGVGQRKSDARNDMQIRRAIQDVLRLDPRVEADGLKVIVNKGLVNLAGSVDTVKAREAALQDARNTVGVWKVENALEVQPAKPKSDRKIASEINSAFQRDAYLNKDKIDVTAEDGKVKLQGRVSTMTKKDRAADVASGVEGAREVENALEVDDTSQAADHDPLSIKYGILNRMYWSSLIESSTVNVIVDEDGVVTLTGYVSSDRAFQTANEIARDAGATEIRNQLLVRVPK